MSKRLQTYERDEVTVTFDPNVCIHSAVCLRALPGVFDVKRATWIDLSAASADAVVETVGHCPSGALQVRRPEDGMESKQGTAEPVTVEPIPNGPVRLEGTLRIIGEDGTVDERTGKVFLCRCGGSTKKPFCDGSHKRIGFRSTAEAEAS
ncbi:MAG: (4Fe-4S)-binding protein [Gemmatimonadota bacterium]|nr:(4Fe-4S)-binding protein [Gemmatimonadota bacterium]MDH4350139.1 (4Fe-4S)-binding protein [Gemmatimonadota bacterium]MDH5196563.1 (4Fe-4S)-binding protein [Gemmatimonadota bacterium]